MSLHHCTKQWQIQDFPDGAPIPEFGAKPIITTHNSSCGKVMFSHASVNLYLFAGGVGIPGTRFLLGVMLHPMPLWGCACAREGWEYPGMDISMGGYVQGVWVCPGGWVCLGERGTQSSYWHLVAATTYMVSKWAVYILLECLDRQCKDRVCLQVQ